MWRAAVYIACARPFERHRTSKIRVFFRQFLAKSILGTRVVGISSGKFFSWAICSMAFIKKILAHATPLGSAHTNFKNWNIFFEIFHLFNFWIVISGQLIFEFCCGRDMLGIGEKIQKYLFWIDDILKKTSIFSF